MNKRSFKYAWGAFYWLAVGPLTNLNRRLRRTLDLRRNGPTPCSVLCCCIAACNLRRVLLQTQCRACHNSMVENGYGPPPPVEWCS